MKQAHHTTVQPAQREPGAAPLSELALLASDSDDWVDEIKQWCLTGSRQTVPRNDLPLASPQIPANPAASAPPLGKGG